MTKTELIKGLSEEMGLTKKEVEERIAFNDKVIEFATKGEGKTKIGSYYTVEKKHVEEKSGVCNGKEFTTPEHDEMIIKRTSVCKRV